MLEASVQLDTGAQPPTTAAWDLLSSALTVVRLVWHHTVALDDEVEPQLALAHGLVRCIKSDVDPRPYNEASPLRGIAAAQRRSRPQHHGLR